MPCALLSLPSGPAGSYAGPPSWPSARTGSPPTSRSPPPPVPRRRRGLVEPWSPDRARARSGDHRLRRRQRQPQGGGITVAGGPGLGPPTCPRPTAMSSGSARSSTPSSSSSPAGPPTTRSCRGPAPREPRARRRFTANTACFSREPDRPPFGRACQAVERKEPGRARPPRAARRRWPGRAGQGSPAAVLRLVPRPAVHPQARTPLDPVRRGPRNSQCLAPPPR